jgi:hypothetical protein
MTTTLEFPSENFCLFKIKTLYDSAPFIKNENSKFVKDITTCQVYFKKYIYPLNNGDCVMYNADKKLFELQNKDEFQTVYLKRCPKELAYWFNNTPCVIFKRTVKLNKPLIFENNINFAGKFKYAELKQYKDFSQEIKNKLQLVLDFYKEVWGSKDNANYEFIMNWIANMAQGNKNTSILYLKSSVQGIGKSLGTEFLIKYVIGNDLSITSGGRPLLSQFNKSLFGKLLVVFEELETAGKSEWEKITNKIKTMTTCDTLEFEEKNEKSFTAENISNIIIATNNEAIKETEGRRIYNADISSGRKGDDKYFNNLVDTCFNDEVGFAFYCLMKERDVSKFNPQKFPETKSRNLIDRLHPIYKALKFYYLFPKKDIKMTVQQLYEELQLLCKEKFTKILMCKKLDEVGISFKKSNGENHYKISNETLQEIATKHSWFNQFDEEDYAELIKETSKSVKQGKELTLQGNFCALQKAHEINEKQKKEIELLKKQLEELKEEIPVNNEEDKMLLQKAFEENEKLKEQIKEYKKQLGIEEPEKKTKKEETKKKSPTKASAPITLPGKGKSKSADNICDLF